MATVTLSDTGQISTIATTQNILNSFELLCISEKWEIASEIIKRALKFDFPPLTDEELDLSADQQLNDETTST